MHTNLKRALLGAFLILFSLFIPFSAFSGGQPTTNPAPEQSNQVQQEQTEIFPLVIVDDLGTSVTIPSKPETILSLSLFSDEVLLEILPIERFAGISSLAQSPVYSNVWDKAAEIEPVIEFNGETIISIYPDLVIAANWSEADKVSQLRQAGIPVFLIDTPSDIEGIRNGITRLGQITGESDSAKQLIQEMDNRLKELESIIASIPQENRVSALDYNSWGTANGKDTTWNLILELAGIQNAVAHLETGDFGQVPLSKEVLVDVDPELLFLPGYIWGEENGAEAFYQQIRNDPALQGLQAIQNQRLYIFPEQLKGTYSQYLVEAAFFAAKQAYPGSF